MPAEMATPEPDGQEEGRTATTPVFYPPARV